MSRKPNPSRVVYLQATYKGNRRGSCYPICTATAVAHVLNVRHEALDGEVSRSAIFKLRNFVEELGRDSQDQPEILDALRKTWSTLQKALKVSSYTERNRNGFENFVLIS